MRNFSEEWDDRYRAGTHLSRWPWSDVVGYVNRYARNAYRVLELGCGAGANFPFFEELCIDYSGIDGSETIIRDLRDRFKAYKDKFYVGDFTNHLPYLSPFDLVIDRCSVTCNSTVAIENCLSEVRRVLKKDGIFIGIDWFSTAHSEFAHGSPSDDINTKTGYTEGPFAHTGRVHFSDVEHIEYLFRDFDIVALAHKTIAHRIPNHHSTYATWNIVAKPKGTSA